MVPFYLALKCIWNHQITIYKRRNPCVTAPKTYWIHLMAVWWAIVNLNICSYFMKRLYFFQNFIDPTRLTERKTGSSFVLSITEEVNTLNIIGEKLPALTGQSDYCSTANWHGVWCVCWHSFNFVVIVRQASLNLPSLASLGSVLRHKCVRYWDVPLTT